MKILTVSNLYPPDVLGGYELRCQELVDGLRGRGHEVSVLTTSPNAGAGREPHVNRSLRPASGYREGDTSLSAQVESHLLSARNVQVLLSALEDGRPDAVLLSNLLGLGAFGVLSCLADARVPWVWRLGDAVPLTMCSLQGELVPALAASFAQWYRGHHLVVSQHLLDEMSTLGVRLSGTVELFPAWITGVPALSRERRYRPGQDQLRICFAGGDAEHKGLDILLGAVARLRTQGGPDPAVEVFGVVHEPNPVQRVGELGLHGVVLMRGWVEQNQLLGHFQTSDVLAFPTWEREPFGGVALQAAAYGCVPLVTDAAGIGDWLVDCVHCVKVARDPTALADLMRDVMRGSIDLEPLRRRAMRMIWGELRLEHLLPRVEDALAEAASTLPRGRPRAPDEIYRSALAIEHDLRAAGNDVERILTAAAALAPC